MFAFRLLQLRESRDSLWLIHVAVKEVILLLQEDLVTAETYASSQSFHTFKGKAYLRGREIDAVKFVCVSLQLQEMVQRNSKTQNTGQSLPVQSFSFSISKDLGRVEARERGFQIQRRRK